MCWVRVGGMKKPLLAVGIAAAVSTSAVVPVASAAPAVVGGREARRSLLRSQPRVRAHRRRLTL